MGHPAGEWNDGTIRVDFNRRLKLEFHGSRITSDAGLLAYRELDDALRLTDLAGAALAECRRGKNTRHLLTGLFRQSVFGRLAGYEDVNDADRLAHDPAMRAVVDRNGLDQRAASTSQMDSSVSETHGAQEGSAYNGHYGRTCRCSCSTNSATWSAAPCGPAMCILPMAGARCSNQ